MPVSYTEFKTIAGQSQESSDDFSSVSDSFGSAFTFDFARNPSRPKRLLLRDMIGPGWFGRSSEMQSAESSPMECNGSKFLEMQLRLQSQQEELSSMQQEQAKLREELASQKVHLSPFQYFNQCNGI